MASTQSLKSFFYSTLFFFPSLTCLPLSISLIPPFPTLSIFLYILSLYFLSLYLSLWPPSLPSSSFYLSHLPLYLFLHYLSLYFLSLLPPSACDWRLILIKISFHFFRFERIKVLPPLKHDGDDLVRFISLGMPSISVVVVLKMWRNPFFISFELSVTNILITRIKKITSNDFDAKYLLLTIIYYLAKSHTRIKTL